jgi:4-hydroxy-3-polyprenylbenzoate decarboxylase
MGYRTLSDTVNDLQRHGHLVAIDDVVDAKLEAAEIHRRVYRSCGPAILFRKVKDCRFPMVSNLFGTLDRARFMFRDSLESIKRAIELKLDPQQLMRRPARYWKAPFTAWTMRPKRVRSAASLAHPTTIDQLPELVSWPDDGGPYVTLPLVYTEDPIAPGLNKSNLGMYRVQLSGNQYRSNEQMGLHYQIHRGIGVHHTEALRLGVPLRVNIFVGGSPAMMLSAVMPLPEGMSELTFAGALAAHRIRMCRDRVDWPAVYADADFCISGTIEPNMLPEGPFGDHLGYYSLAHDFPVLKIERITHRTNAIWPFTVVGRPPQEDTTFGQLIHEITEPIIPTVIPGVRQVHAVDAAGVHPLLLAIGSERYDAYRKPTRPQELLTQANAILGQGQMSLAKYLLIVNGQDDPGLSAHEIERLFTHLLARIDWSNDLHFQTRTTIDTLDYSGSGFNQGSKVIWAATGSIRRELQNSIPSNFSLPDDFQKPKVVMPGVIAIQAPGSNAAENALPRLDRFCSDMAARNSHAGCLGGFPLIVVVDDSEFVARTLSNFLWVTFTRSNPAVDIFGIDSFVEHKHWGCRGPLVIDARIKPHHAPPLIEDPGISRRVDAMAARGGPLAKYL